MKRKQSHQSAAPNDSDLAPSAPELSVEAAAALPTDPLAPTPSKAPDTAELLKDWKPGPETPDGDEVIKEAKPDSLNEKDELADPETDKAVAEIVAAEGDEVLAIEDAVKDTQDNPTEKSSFRQRLARFLKKPIVRWVMTFIFISAIVSAIIVPDIRYAVLNTAGVRSSSSLTVIDGSTRQPLKNTTVELGSHQATTDGEGNVRLYELKLGKQTLTVQKRGFASATKDVTIGWGSNPLGDIELTPTGAQYKFVITDYLSGKPLAKAEITSGEASAISDASGRAKLTVDRPGDSDFKATVSIAGLRAETVIIHPDASEEVNVRMVPARKHIFVSERSGKLDLYSVYADGKQEKRILAGSGSERQEDMVLVPHPSEATVAYVSTRGNQATSEGSLLSNLILVDSNSGETTNIIASEQITVLGWSGDHLIYRQITANTNAQSPRRYALTSYNYRTGDNKELAHANYFNSAVLFGGQVYYAPNGGIQGQQTKFYRTNPDGTNAKPILDQQVWQIIRVGYEELALSVQQQWFTYLQGAQTPTKRSAAPANPQTRTYIDGPNGKQSAWVDIRDGKGVLLVYNLGTKTDTVLSETSGLTYPVRWLSPTVLVYRVNSAAETADYVVSTEGGTPLKLTDITASQGLGTALALQP